MFANEDRDNAWRPLATMSEAHREWHLNAGVPMGQPGCPQDACHPVDDDIYEPQVKCGYCKARHSVAAVRLHAGIR